MSHSCRILAGCLSHSWRFLGGCWPRFVETYVQKVQKDDVFLEVPHLSHSCRILVAFLPRFVETYAKMTFAGTQYFVLNGEGSKTPMGQRPGGLDEYNPTYIPSLYVRIFQPMKNEKKEGIGRGTRFLRNTWGLCRPCTFLKQFPCRLEE